MKKMVNGQIVELGDIKLFELAFEGLALNKLAVSNITTTIDKESSLISECISLYNEVYRRLPFPLYSLETPVKYAAIARYMREALQHSLVEEDKAGGTVDTVDEEAGGTEESSKNIINTLDSSGKRCIKDLDFWIEDGLNILVDKDIALKLIGNTWGIEGVKEIHLDNTSLDLYKDATGYKELKWAIEKIMQNEVTSGLYAEFMPEFLKACKNDPMLIKWELGRILDFGFVPEEVELDNNKVVDFDDGSIYILDVYSKGRVKTGDKIREVELTPSGIRNMGRTVDRYITTYDYSLYKKSLRNRNDNIESESYGQLTKVNMESFGSIFKTILSIGMARDNVDGMDVSGIIKGNHLVYSIANRVYRCDSTKFSESKEIAKNMTIYGQHKDRIYLKKEHRIKPGIIKEVIYAVDLENDSFKLCKISYRNS